MKRIHVLLFWTVVALWMAIIFYLSHQPASVSSDLSSGLTAKILGAIEKIIPGEDINVGAFHHYVRKNAHFFIYFILGMLVLNAFRRSHIGGFRSIIFTLLICVLYATSDEIHQLFIAGRSGEARDVLIDGSGASIGIAFYVLIRWMVKRRGVFASKEKYRGN